MTLRRIPTATLALACLTLIILGCADPIQIDKHTKKVDEALVATQTGGLVERHEVTDAAEVRKLQRAVFMDTVWLKSGTKLDREGVKALGACTFLCLGLGPGATIPLEDVAYLAPAPKLESVWFEDPVWPPVAGMLPLMALPRVSRIGILSDARAEADLVQLAQTMPSVSDMRCLTMIDEADRSREAWIPLMTKKGWELTLLRVDKNRSYASRVDYPAAK